MFCYYHLIKSLKIPLTWIIQDKILLSTGRDGTVTVTNDGATILKAIGVDNPAAKVLVGTFDKVYYYKLIVLHWGIFIYSLSLIKLVLIIWSLFSLALALYPNHTLFLHQRLVFYAKKSWTLWVLSQLALVLQNYLSNAHGRKRLG